MTGVQTCALPICFPVTIGGLPIVYGTCKLLDMLGYGSVLASSNTAKAAITQKYLGVDGLSDANNPLVYSTSQTVNMLPLLAYQKIYYDFFSNSQWEKHLAYAYNVDYWSGSGSISLAVNMVKLRYANYPKDYFMGMLPNSQYGSVAVLPNSIDPNYSGRTVYATGKIHSIVKNPSDTTSVITAASQPYDRNLVIGSDLSALR